MLREEVSEIQVRRELFGEKLEMISEALVYFKNGFDTTIALRAQEGEKANDLAE